MSNALRISICDPNDSTRDDLKKYLVGMDRIWLEADCSRYEFFSEIVEQTNPDVAIVDIDSDEPRALQLIEEVVKKFTNCRVIAVSSRTEGQLILNTMRAGARECLNSPVSIEELVNALDRVSADSESGGRSKKSGTVISCLLYTSPSPRDGLLSRMPSSA